MVSPVQQSTQSGTGRGRSDAALLESVCGAIADDLHVLAALHDREASLDLLVFLRDIEFPRHMALAVVSDRVREAATLFSNALDSLNESPGKQALDELAADYAAIYLNNACHASPCESVWVDLEGLALQEATFQIRSWYRHFGLVVENWRKRSDDHLVAQLHFVELLLRRANDVDVKEIARFMDEHLLRWLPAFSARVAGRCATQFYAGAALLTAAYCEDVRDLLAEIVGEPRPSAEEIEKRMKPKQDTKAVPVVFHPGTAPSW